MVKVLEIKKCNSIGFLQEAIYCISNNIISRIDFSNSLNLKNILTFEDSNYKLISCPSRIIIKDDLNRIIGQIIDQILKGKRVFMI